MTTTVTRIDKDIELVLQGIPESLITPMQEAKITLGLLQKGVNVVGEASAGLLGGIRKATIRIGEEYYTLKYSLRVLGPMVQLDVYSLSIRYIETKISDGTFDEPMGRRLIQWLRDDQKATLEGRKGSTPSPLDLFLGL